MIVAELCSLSRSSPLPGARRAASARAVIACASLAMSVGVSASELKFTTDDSLKIEGFQKSTGKCETGFQSAEMMLSVIGREDLSHAVGTTKASSTMLRLDQGWTFVRVLCDESEVRAEPGDDDAAPEDAENVAPDSGPVVPGWVFLLIHKSGAGAEGTDFIAEMDGPDALYYADADNTTFVWLAVSCPTLADPDRTKDVKLSPGQFARIEPDSASANHQKVNGVSCCALTSGDVLANEPVPAGKQAFHAAALAEVAANGY